MASGCQGASQGSWARSAGGVDGTPVNRPVSMGSGSSWSSPVMPSDSGTGTGAGAGAGAGVSASGAMRGSTGGAQP